MQHFFKAFLLLTLSLIFIACKKDYAKKMTGVYKGSTKYFLRDSSSAIKDTVLSESKITIEHAGSRNTVKITISNLGMQDFVYKEVSVSGDKLQYVPAPMGGFAPTKIVGTLTDNTLLLSVEHRTTGPYAWTMDIKALK
ncbi:hypothetical protein ESA94_18950 [Lacibacter luteus]|uniref:Lipocalin-like domain-containing protein n=1 Tax=Lacibacter luteus TaxID=2508719 RepID=A0A4Q1CE67_9BACT|nr:hypothetical protein [Lacibacter luteus]RXK58093.1 hypothetical protein ESA94_18950 [Lacibacter luteus]